MSKLRVIIFDVDHGFSAFVRTPNGYGLMIDCGAADDFSPVEYLLRNEIPSCRQFRGYQLTKLIVTHPHEDHIRDIGKIIEQLQPALLSNQMYRWEDLKVGTHGSYTTLDEYSNWTRNSFAPSPFWAPPDYGCEILMFRLTPEEAAQLDNNPQKVANNSSLCVFVTFGGMTILFPGDLEETGWRALLRSEGFRAQLSRTSILVAAHHGHSAGFCADIFDYMQYPLFAVASVTRQDPNRDTRYSSSKYFRGLQFEGSPRYMFSTRDDGSIFLEVDECGLLTVDTVDLRPPARNQNSDALWQLAQDLAAERKPPVTKPAGLLGLALDRSPSFLGANSLSRAYSSTQTALPSLSFLFQDPQRQKW